MTHSHSEIRHDVSWQEGVPVSTVFDDPFYSLVDGMAETGHVFLAGNDLPGRFRAGFHIAELGFGSGLNFLCALAAWRAACVAGPMRFTSFEAFPMSPEDATAALSRFPGVAETAGMVAAALAQDGRYEDDGVELRIVYGDARETLPGWEGQADAWFLDGFSPAKNPALWEPNLMAEVARHTAPGGTFATYTAAGHVRRALTAAGFDVERVPGFGRKRHMTRGVLA